MRVGERGSGEFQEISWDEALATATGWLGEVRERDPRKLAFFTGRDQSQALTGWLAQQFGTPNYRRPRRLLLGQHGGRRALHHRRLVLGVRRAGLGAHALLHAVRRGRGPRLQPDQDRARQAEGARAPRSSRSIRCAPAIGAIADEWIGIRPGTDGLFVGALIHELLRAEKVDLDYLVRYTNAPWLVIDDPGAADDGLFARDADGKPLAFDKAGGALADATRAGIAPALVGQVHAAGRPQRAAGRSS